MRPVASLCLLIINLFFLFSAHSIESPDTTWRFVEISKSAGVNMTVVAGSSEKNFLVETMTGGSCVLDYDKDGWPDIFFVNGTTREFWNKGTGPSDRLFRNNHDGTFSDATEKAGLKDSAWGMGCVAAD